VTTISDTAKAKINLSLEVLGRRADDFHEIRSLVAFASIADTLTLETGETLSLDLDGAFARALAGRNLILEAAEAALAAHPGLKLGRFHLTKNLPVASGIGGGSADAAAALRLIARANGTMLQEESAREIAARLGSDVPVCLASQPALMTGRGETVQLVEDLPKCGVLLANPGLPLSSGQVYAELRAAPYESTKADENAAPDFAGDFARFIEYLAPRGNDLEPAALRLAPAIGEVLDALERLPGGRLTRMSGSGATCFALFATEAEAETASRALTASRPDWWVRAGTLG